MSAELPTTVTQPRTAHAEMAAAARAAARDFEQGVGSFYAGAYTGIYLRTRAALEGQARVTELRAGAVC